MTKTNKWIMTHKEMTFTAKTKSDLIISMAKKGVAIDEAELLVKEHFTTDKQRIGATKRANTASIKSVATKLTLARKLNATLNAKSSKAWTNAREQYAKYYDVAEMSNKQIEKDILTLIKDIVTLEGFEA